MMPYKVRKTLGPPSMPDMEGPCVIEDGNGRTLATMEGFGSDEQYRLACKIVGQGALMEKMAEALERINQWDWPILLRYADCDMELFDDLENAEKALQEYRE